MGQSELKIDKIVLKLGQIEVALSIDECQKLQKILNDLFQKQVITEVIKEEYHHHYPYWLWTYPQPLWQTDKIGELPGIQPTITFDAQYHNEKGLGVVSLNVAS